MRPAFFMFAWVRLCPYYTMGEGKAQYFFKTQKFLLTRKRGRGSMQIEQRVKENVVKF